MREKEPLTHPSQVPPNMSREQKTQFWKNHEVTKEYLEALEPTPEHLLPPPRSRPISIRFDEDVLQRLKDVAQKKGKPYQSLLKEFVVQRLHQEEEREGIIAEAPREEAPPAAQSAEADAMRITVDRIAKLLKAGAESSTTDVTDTRGRRDVTETTETRERRDVTETRRRSIEDKLLKAAAEARGFFSEEDRAALEGKPVTEFGNEALLLDGMTVRFGGMSAMAIGNSIFTMPLAIESGSTSEAIRQAIEQLDPNPNWYALGE